MATRHKRVIKPAVVVYPKSVVSLKEQQNYIKLIHSKLWKKDGVLAKELQLAYKALSEAPPEPEPTVKESQIDWDA